MGKITKIFITHLHGDHLFGLNGLLSTLANGLDPSKAVKKQVDVYGPHGLYKYITVSLELSRSKLAYKLNIFELMPEADQFGRKPDPTGSDWIRTRSPASERCCLRNYCL